MNESRNGAFRPKRVNFAQISNVALRDSALSLKAKGLYSLIQSLITMPGVDLHIGKIRDRCKEGDKAFDSAWTELKKAGYLKQYRIPNGVLRDGKRGYKYEYDLLDQSDLKIPSIINLDKFGHPIPPKDAKNTEGKKTGKSSASNGKSRHTPQKGGYGKTEVKTDIDTCPKQENNSTFSHIPNGGDERQAGTDHPHHTPLFVPCAKSSGCETHPVSKGGGNSNTKLRNTLFSNTKPGNTPSVSQSQPDPVRQTDGQTDEIRGKLLEQINFDWIAETHPNDVPAADTLLDCMVEMLSVPFTKIRGVSQSRYAIKKRLEKVDEEDIVGFLAHMREREIAPKNIRNISAYWKSAFVNYIREQDLAASVF